MRFKVHKIIAIHDIANTYLNNEKPQYFISIQSGIPISVLVNNWVYTLKYDPLGPKELNQ